MHKSAYFLHIAAADFIGLLARNQLEEQHRRGLSPETAAALRANILGIQPPDDMAEEEAEVGYEEMEFTLL